jgi:hypothetical protein
MPPSIGIFRMHEGRTSESFRGGRVGTQENSRTPDVRMPPMMQHTAKAADLGPTVPSGRRTVVALVSASIISIVVWGLVVVLNVH